MDYIEYRGWILDRKYIYTTYDSNIIDLKIYARLTSQKTTKNNITIDIKGHGCVRVARFIGKSTGLLKLTNILFSGNLLPDAVFFYYRHAKSLKAQ